MQIFVRDKSFYRKALIIAVPITLQSMITIGINLMDTVMLGSFGEAQLSASSLANQFYNIFQICCMGLGGGAAVMTAQYWGRGDIAPLKKTYTIMLRLCIVIALGFTAATLLLPGQIMGLYSKEPHIIEYGIKYFRVLALTYLLQGLSLTTTIVMRSVGKVKVPLMCSVCAFFVNIFFNWVFIFGKLGAPQLEIVGAAIGTLISRAFECVFIFGEFCFLDKKVGYRLNQLFVKCGGLLREYFRFSMPVLISDLLLALGGNAVAIIMGHIGSVFVAANAITMVVQQISTVFNQGVANSSSIMTGNTIGEGEPEKAYRQGVTFFALSAIVGLIGSGVILLVSPLVVGFYNIAPETAAIARELMASLAFMSVFNSISMVMTKGVLRGGGDTRFLMVADILFLWVASVPLGFLAGLVWNLSPFWIFACLRIEMPLKSVWCIRRLMSRKWIRTVR